MLEKHESRTALPGNKRTHCLHPTCAAWTLIAWTLLSSCVVVVDGAPASRTPSAPAAVHNLRISFDIAASGPPPSEAALGSRHHPYPVGHQASVGDYWVRIEKTAAAEKGGTTADLTVGYTGAGSSLTVGAHLAFVVVDRNGRRYEHSGIGYPFDFRLEQNGYSTETVHWPAPYTPGMKLVVDQSAVFMVWETRWMELTPSAGSESSSGCIPLCGAGEIISQ